MSDLSEQIAEVERMQRWGYAAFAPDPEPAPAAEEPAEPPAEE